MDEKWDKLRKWRQENDLISLQAQQDFIQEKRKGVSASLTASEHSQLVLESKITLLKQQLNSGNDPFENPDVLAFGTLSKLKEDKEELIVKRDQLSSKYLKRHPLVVENDKSLESLEREYYLI